MQNIMNSGSSLLANCARQPACCTQLIFVRWRKPRWVPTAPSKIFKLPNRKRPPADEARERKVLKDRYGTQIKALWLHQRALNYGRLFEKLSTETSVKYEQEIDQVIEENNRINAEIRAQREEIMATEWAETEKYILATKAQKELQEEEELKQTEQQILAQIERLKTALKIEDLDEAIEKALSTEVDYNYAIDLAGNKYHGRHTNPQRKSIEARSNEPSSSSSDSSHEQRKEVAA